MLSEQAQAAPVLLIGAGRMGTALIQGWLAAGTFVAGDILVCDPVPPPLPAGVQVNPDRSRLTEARTVLLAVKPQVWRVVAGSYVGQLASEAVILSIVAGVTFADLRVAFEGRSIARIMPTTAVAIGQGAASLYTDDPRAMARARQLFEPIAALAELADEALMHVATAISGSSPAYLYALIEALEAAGLAGGLPVDNVARLVRASLTGAAALMMESGEDPAELRRQVSSPGGVTLAALAILQGPDGLPSLISQAVLAAISRSQALAQS